MPVVRLDRSVAGLGGFPTIARPVSRSAVVAQHSPSPGSLRRNLLKLTGELVMSPTARKTRIDGSLFATALVLAGGLGARAAAASAPPA